MSCRNEMVSASQCCSTVRDSAARAEPREVRRGSHREEQMGGWVLPTNTSPWTHCHQHSLTFHLQNLLVFMYVQKRHCHNECFLISCKSLLSKEGGGKSLYNCVYFLNNDLETCVCWSQCFLLRCKSLASPAGAAVPAGEDQRGRSEDRSQTELIELRIYLWHNSN